MFKSDMYERYLKWREYWDSKVPTIRVGVEAIPFNPPHSRAELLRYRKRMAHILGALENPNTRGFRGRVTPPRAGGWGF